MALTDRREVNIFAGGLIWNMGYLVTLYFLREAEI